MPSASLSLKSLFKSVYYLCKGIYASWRILRKFNPDIVIGFGSYYSLPAVTAALLMRIPVVLHEQNIMPGKVNKLLSRFVKKVLVSFEQTKKYLKGDITTVNYPQKVCTATNYYKERFQQDVPIVLIMGGSQGASSINKSICKVIKKISSSERSIQVIHLIGYQEDVSMYEQFYANLGITAEVKPFEKNMASALSCADFVIARAGAGSIFDLLYFEKPALLIPYPYAGAHQKFNAVFFTDEVKGGYWGQEDSNLEISITQFIKKMLLPSVRKSLIENIQFYKLGRVNIECIDILNQMLISL
ncbi:UDP-N-acetylglucosamine--N-acetylmuramyl- (pentapeptide) pyrophosphoryl-undecaprenol N-acetylglucosamine transferase [Candidatus Clavichlamydia salmonicola]|nr:UDP-N-acetylglucosamine--N-acetylmuramyl- (pentapeptide) pyrophosphoryl-undecaprenol N-acetylglucosamine transferase [Candidatus Clavichlamydia salmonicola]